MEAAEVIRSIRWGDKNTVCPRHHDMRQGGLGYGNH